MLEELSVMGHIEGISGTSAGAITALLLSTRMTAAEIDTELRERDFNTFFDPPLNPRGDRLVPAPFEYVRREDVACEAALLSGGLDPRTLLTVIGCLQNNESTMAKIFGGLGWLYQAEGVLTVAFAACSPV